MPSISRTNYPRALIEGLNRGRYFPGPDDYYKWLVFEDEDAHVARLLVDCLVGLGAGYRRLITHFLGGHRTFGGDAAPVPAA
jgi:hypothetical protein